MAVRKKVGMAVGQNTPEDSLDLQGLSAGMKK